MRPSTAPGEAHAESQPDSSGVRIRRLAHGGRRNCPSRPWPPGAARALIPMIQPQITSGRAAHGPQRASDSQMLEPSEPPSGVLANPNSGKRSLRQRILVIDEDPAVVVAVATSLRLAGYDVEGTVKGSLGLSTARWYSPDLVVLGMRLPDFEFAEALRRLRSDGLHVPILFMGDRGSGSTRVGGLVVGGNDHIPKPFALAEIVARVNSMIHRVSAGPMDGIVHRFADIELDERARQVTRAESAISFTAQEFNLLRYFLVNPHRILSKAQIIDNVWPYDFRGSDTIVPVYVSSLRRGLEIAGPPIIHTVRSTGYSLR
jgi:two-component system OmpR family response regulator